MREPTTTPTFCRICEAGCGLLATTEGDRVVRLDPDKDHVASQGFACVKGLKFANLHHSPDRLDHPMKRVGDRWERIGWDQALAEIGAKVRALRAEHGPDAVAGYLGNPAAFGAFHALAFNAFLEGLGTTQSYSSASQDLTNKYLVAKRLYGHELLQPIPDLDRTDLVVLIGTNPAISQMSVVQVPRAMARLEAVVDRGGRVVSLNPRRTETARAVGEHLFIRPGTDVFFLASFLHVVLAEGGVDHDLVGAHTTGFDDLAAVVADWPPERTEAVTGVAAAELRGLVADYLAADGASLYCSTGVNMGPHGTLAYWLINVVNAVTGNLDHAGGALVRTPPLDFQKASKALGLGVGTARSRVGDFEMILGTFPASLLADEITTPGPGQVRALFVSAGNPVLSVGNGDRLAAALDELELLVSIDLFRNETADHAHYVLPACSWLERPDVPLVHAFAGLQVDPWLQYTEAVVPPAAERREESWIFARLAEACGVGLGPGWPARGLTWALGRLRRVPGLGRLAEVSDARLLALVLEVARHPVRRLRRHPHGVRLPDVAGGEFLGSRVLTDDGRVHLAPADFVTAAAGLGADFEAERTDGGLRLITRRERHSHNTWTHNAEPFVGGDRTTNRLHVGADDAAEAGLTDGGRARVRSKAGEVEVEVAVTDDLMPGVVSLPHGWGHSIAGGLAVARAHAGVNANHLTADGPDGIEALSGMARMTAIPVEVEPA
ncbi:MAG: molybdopterin-dependent oxidoreductase [Acidimicrobiales bacterium]|nr:molybdopterin-dependent oxidoreductase [Acidimicrobiales bacterium]